VAAAHAVTSKHTTSDCDSFSISGIGSPRATDRLFAARGDLDARAVRDLDGDRREVRRAVGVAPGAARCGNRLRSIKR
jgi:hypothetical protein